MHIAIGITAGAILVGVIARLNAGVVTVAGVARLGGYAALMMAVCMLACVVPTRRALRIQPTEAMRHE